MFIIRLLFYLADGTMDSSFLIGFHIGLGLLSCALFIKMIIQFGLPNHPARVVAYMVGFCAAVYFSGLAATDLELITPWMWMKWRSLPLIAGSLCLLLQTIMLIGNFSLIQQKVVSRIPLMAALLCFAFFSVYADVIASAFILLGGLFLIVSVRKARYQKRAYLKMTVMLLLHLGCAYSGWYAIYVLGQLFLIAAVFYMFIFEHSFGVAALLDDFKMTLQEENP
jgi:hypothetical protein